MSVMIPENHGDVLDARFDNVWEERYDNQESYISKIYTITSTPKEDMRFSEEGAFGDIPEFDGNVTYQQRYEGYDVIISPLEYASGYQVSRKLFDDDLMSVFDMDTEGMTDSVWRTRERHAHRPFNMAFAIDTKFYTQSEGVALCSASHTTRASGVSTSTGFSNAGSSALSHTALTAARKTMYKFLDSRGNIINVNPTVLFVGTDNYDVAEEIVGSTLRSDNAENAKNVHDGRYDLWVSQYLNTNPNDWFLIDPVLMKRFMIWIDKVKPEWGSKEEFDTILWKLRVYMRYAMGWRNWRFVYGSDVA